MNDARCFVQFMHPGGEHQPDGKDIKRAGYTKSWNRTPAKHARKFLRLGGEYLNGPDPATGELVFWAEWEPESEAEEIEKPIPDGPQYIYSPYYKVPASYKDLQNTDPFVFGGFCFTGCQQRMKDGATETQLRHLKPGSVILFGSHLHGAFVLDTVFVVGERWIDHDAKSYRHVLQGVIPEIYENVTIGPWYGAGYSGVQPESSYRLYFGATFDNPFNGMFSFFPCLTHAAAPKGFARPKIELPGLVSQGLKQRFNKSCDIAIPAAREHWESARRQVTEQSLRIGVSAALPKRQN